MPLFRPSIWSHLYSYGCISHVAVITESIVFMKISGGTHISVTSATTIFVNKMLFLGRNTI
jgi:hypothetical protein